MLTRLVCSLTDNDLENLIAEYFRRDAVQVECYGQLNNAWQLSMQSCGDIIVISESLVPSPVDAGIRNLNSLPEKPTTIIIHDSNSVENDARLLAAGASVVLSSSVTPKNLIFEAIDAALESRFRLIRVDSPWGRMLEQPTLADFYSTSESMQLFINMVRNVASSESVVLLQGETGVGKEHLARAIHVESPRSREPFVALNMAALPEQLLESELFGHTKGAFTGATRARRGAFEMAHTGTIFLDEIGEMPLHLQARLLRVLQDYEVRPLGGEKPIFVDVRVIASTNCELDKEVEEGRFRKDLYFRLNIMTLVIPPLRERREDIPILVRRFLKYYRYKIKSHVYQVSDSAMEALCQYDWPGNVRELMNILERALILCRPNRITLDDLPAVFHKEDTGTAVPPSGITFDRDAWLEKPLPVVRAEVMAQLEKMYCEMVLDKTGGRINKAADIAGIQTRSLYNIMKRLGLRKEDFRRR
jgi:two-component system response regulator AtoC